MGFSKLRGRYEAMLNDTNYLKKFGPNKPVTDKEFENVDLLKSLMSDENKGRSTASLQHSSTPRSSADNHSIGSKARGRPKPSPISSQENDCGKVVEPPSGACQPRESPEMVVPRGTPPSRSVTPLDLIQRPNPPVHFNTTSSQEQVPCTVPTSMPTTGLQALFQQPVRLKSKPESSLNGSGYLRDATIYGDSVPYRNLPSTTPSTESLRSQGSRLSMQNPPTSHGFQAFRPNSPHKSPGRPLHSDQLNKLASQPVLGHSAEKEAAVTSDQNSQSRSNGLSQLFVYQSRPIKKSPNGSSNSPAPDSTVLCELESTTTASVKPTGVETTSARSASTSSSAETQSSSLCEIAENPQSLDSGLPVSEPGRRRDMVDSEAWQRRTKMFQT
ncbi:hypothetical protein F4779DRAFT_609228 [Xylariaceae sp. FL0662B]|nr:hypothetical protein F4779DRAFT_609228 [Xylariaceae sp. FL0662B]